MIISIFCNRINLAQIVALLLLLTSNTIVKSQNSNDHFHEVEANTLPYYLIDSLIVYNSDDLIILKHSNHIYQHISFLNTTDYGKVACNGMIVMNKKEAVVFDTPTNNENSQKLITFITKNLDCKIIALIPTHFHEDCVGGLESFQRNNIPSYASDKTIEILQREIENFSYQLIGFNDSLEINIQGKKVRAEFLGEGHTQDNIIGYFADEDAIFGGCLIKTDNASKGFLGDANTNEWSATVGKLKLKYASAKLIIPGHGKFGGQELLDYTIKLFKLDNEK